jgi:hypothetical protein
MAGRITETELRQILAANDELFDRRDTVKELVAEVRRLRGLISLLDSLPAGTLVSDPAVRAIEAEARAIRVDRGWLIQSQSALPSSKG